MAIAVKRGLGAVTGRRRYFLPVQGLKTWDYKTWNGRAGSDPAGAEEPSMIKGVKFVSISVRDQDRALDFYTGKLGFTILTDQPMGEGQRWIELSIPGADTCVVLFTPSGHEDRIGGFSNIAFYSDNVERTYDQLVARGVEFVQPPKRESWGTSAIFKDPDGNQFVFSSR
jgi:catechol 2,3-dioxygenase-like lactoylglutathione lyase family enzyme